MNIFLCGFMGCGKTTVGKELSKALGYTFVALCLKKTPVNKRGECVRKALSQKHIF